MIVKICVEFNDGSKSSFKTDTTGVSVFTNKTGHNEPALLFYSIYSIVLANIYYNNVSSFDPESEFTIRTRIFNLYKYKLNTVSRIIYAIESTTSPTESIIEKEVIINLTNDEDPTNCSSNFEDLIYWINMLQKHNTPYKATIKEKIDNYSKHIRSIENVSVYFLVDRLVDNIHNTKFKDIVTSIKLGDFINDNYFKADNRLRSDDKNINFARIIGTYFNAGYTLNFVASNFDAVIMLCISKDNFDERSPFIKMDGIPSNKLYVFNVSRGNKITRIQDPNRLVDKYSRRIIDNLRL